MRILVYDIAAEDGGGRYVLTQFYNELVEETKRSISFAEEYEWFLVTSLCTFTEYEHIHVLTFPEAKRSRKNRIAFDLFKIRKLLKEIKPDRIISLQNNPVIGTRIPQVVYLHQSLQYCPKRYSFFKKEERTTAFRQKIICGMYKHELPRAGHIFVQTQWMKQATADWLHCGPERISVIPMKLPEVPAPSERTEMRVPREGETCFFYPARDESYKNHEVIVEASRILRSQGIDGFRVLFTMSETSGGYARLIAEKSRDLPIELIGNVPHDMIWSYYAQCVLVFPSYMETVGLPMLEAKAAGGRILASDLPFSHEDLDGYAGASFFRYSDPQELAELMKKAMTEPTFTETTVCGAENMTKRQTDADESNIMKRVLCEIRGEGQ